MKLYGRDLSPYTRRVAIWCAFQGRNLERFQLMVSGPEWETLKAVNPMGRVPALVLDDGEVLIETNAIIDHLEETAPNHQLIPNAGADRRKCLQDIAYATATAEKAVALVYDKTRRPPEFHHSDWIARLEAQITAGLDVMEVRTPQNGWYSGGNGPEGADIAVVTTFDFIAAVFPELSKGYPKLTALSALANAIPTFADTKPAL